MSADLHEDTPDTDAPETAVLPLDAWHRARGGRMVPFAGYLMPVQYEGIMAEHLWTREAAGLFDVSHMGQLLIEGPGAGDALEALLPGDLRILKPGRMRYSLLLSEGGGILDDLMVTRLRDAHAFADADDTGDEMDGGEAFYMVVNGATKWDDIGHLRESLDDGITIRHLDDRALLAVQGPRAVEEVAKILPGVEALVFMQSGLFDWQGHAVWASRSGYTGEDGLELSIGADVAAAFADLLAEGGVVKPVGLGARDSLRLEAGLPLYGHDLDEGTTPVAADLGFALSKRRREEGGFPGAERILAERDAGPATKRVGLAVEGRQPVREGASVVDASGAEIGRVTSGGHAPSVGGPIAMAYVPAELAGEGTLVSLTQRGRLHRARVVPMPFVPHRYVRQSQERR